MALFKSDVADQMLLIRLVCIWGSLYFRGGARMPNEFQRTDIHELMLRNAEKLRQLYDRIKITVHERDKSPEKYLEWKRACEEFHFSYDALAFPGGVQSVDMVESGDQNSIEAAISFLECRPYFHRSGYLFKVILKRVKRASLTEQQRDRVKRVIEARDEWRRNLPSLLHAKAEEGSCDAQRKLGELYTTGYKYGQQLKSNKIEAVKWLSAAAEQGDAKAQQELAFQHALSNPPDWGEAYFWLGLAAKYSDDFVDKKLIEDDRRKAADKLSVEQRQDIDRRVADWNPMRRI